MKFQFFIITVFSFIILSCSSNEDIYEGDTTVTINFHHYWGDTEINTSDYENTTYITENLDVVTIESVKYILSDIYIQNGNDAVTALTDYLFINPKEDQNLIFSTQNLLNDGTFDLYFRFGFSDDDNIDDAYPELDAENFNLPDGFGGGYYYMQFDGQFYANGTDTDTTITDTTTLTDFEYYTARDVEFAGTDSATFGDTSFTVHLSDVSVSNKSGIIDVKVDLSQWFTDTHTWILTDWYIDLLSNSPAQKAMNQNGDSVFSILTDDEETDTDTTD